MEECLDFVEKKALIFHQEDYSLAKLAYKEMENLPATKMDANVATQIAQGFGIKNKNITNIEDMTSS